MSLVVAGVRGRTKTAQGHVVRRVESVEGLEERATGLVPGFAGYPSSTTVESERIVGVVVVEGKTRLSDDEDAVEDDVGSNHDRSKRWGESAEGRRGRRMPVEGAVAVVDDGKTVLSVDETG